jgi:hypothetical protein
MCIRLEAAQDTAARDGTARKRGLDAWRFESASAPNEGPLRQEEGIERCDERMSLIEGKFRRTPWSTGGDYRNKTQSREAIHGIGRTLWRALTPQIEVPGANRFQV